MRKEVKTRKLFNAAEHRILCILHKKILTPNANKVGSTANTVLTVMVKRVNAALTYSHTGTENQSEKDVKQSSFMPQT